MPEVVVPLLDAFVPDEVVPVTLLVLPEVVVLAGTSDPVFATNAPAVIATGIYVKSVPVNVSVERPGSLASVPPADTAQTAEELAREQET